MYFTTGSKRAFEYLMQQTPGFDSFEADGGAEDENCGTCRFYRPKWKYEFCVFEECPYCPGKRTRKSNSSVERQTLKKPCKSRLVERGLSSVPAAVGIGSILRKKLL